MQLYDWTTHYIKFKDCMKKNIQEMKFEEETIEVIEKKQTIRYYIHEDLNHCITKLNKKKSVIIINNTKKNVDELIEKWDLLRTYQELTIIFVHPKENQTWSIHPSTHHKITEEKNLKESLLTLFNNVARV